MTTTTEHPELNKNTVSEIRSMMMELAHKYKTGKRVTREAMLQAAEDIGMALKPPIAGSDVISFVANNMNERRKVLREERHAKIKQELEKRMELQRATNAKKVEKPVEKQKANTFVPAGNVELVDEENDPFSEKSRTMFSYLTNSLRDVQVGQTVRIPFDNYEVAVKMREMLHAISKKLRWVAVQIVTDDGNIIYKSYMATIMRDGLYVKRFG